MSNSVVPAAAATHAKQLVRNKKLIKRTEEHKASADEQQGADKDDDAANAIQSKQADHLRHSMSDTSMSADFSFSGALSDAADSASLAESSAQDEGGSVDDDGDGAGGTVLLVAGVGLVGLGVAVAAGGGGNKNEAPDITSGSTASVAENAAISTVVYTTVATDPDGDVLTYSLTGTDAAAFAISADGKVTLKASADFEAKASYSFNVVATDPDGLSDTQAVTLAITNVTGAGDPPVFTSGTTAGIAENSAVTTVVYDANVTGTGATFALSGADAAAFTIDADDGEVRFIASPNFEAKSSYSIDVIATQGGATSTRTVAVSVTNVSEAPTFTSGTTGTVAENAPTSTVVYDANVSGSAATTFALTGADAAAFTIDADDGEVRLKTSADFETKTSYSIGVVASSGGESTTQAVTISVTDVTVEGPTFASGTSVNFDENSATSNVVYDANATGAGTIAYSLTGADANAFTINTTTGEVRFKASPDFEADPSYSITVVATDSNGASSRDVLININDIEPESTTLTIDTGNPSSSTGVVVQVGTGAFTLTEDIDVNSNVIIRGFTLDDIIEITGTDDFDDYSFRTGTGAAGENDLVIEQQNSGQGTANIILIEDVLVNAGFVFDYESAKDAVGFDFMTFA